MIPVVWEQGPPEKATLVWVKSMEMNRDERPTWIFYSDTDQAKEDTAADKKPETSLHRARLGWDPTTKQWASVFDGACWELFTTRFGTTGSTEDTALAAGLARMSYAINRKPTGGHPMPVVLLIGAVNFMPGMTSVEPLRPRTPEEIFTRCGTRLDRLEESIEQLIRLGQNPIDPDLVREFIPSHQGNTLPSHAPRQPQHLGAFHNQRLKVLGIDPYQRPQPHIMASGQLIEHCGVDIFSRLPRELLLCILPHVDFKDLPSLRLASRTVAAVSSLDQLPTSYWKTRFLNAYPYAVPTTLGEAPNWRALCFVMEPLFRPRWGTRFWGSGHITSASRRVGIWRRLLFVRDLICRTAQGFPVNMEDWKGMTADLEAKWRPRRQSVRLVRGQLHDKKDKGPDIIMRRSPWVTRDYRLRGIGVTTTRLGRKSMITGIRFFHQVDGSKVYASDEIGYTSFTTETVSPVAENEDLRSIRVMYSNDSGAITGIKFVFSNAVTRVSRTTDWINSLSDWKQSGETLATIHRSCPLLPFTIIGSFDVRISHSCPSYQTSCADVANYFIVLWPGRPIHAGCERCFFAV